MSFRILHYACAAITAVSTSSLSAAVFSFEFNTAGSTEGWTASTTPANNLVSGFAQATSVDGSTGVLTSSDIAGDPQILRNGAPNIIALPAGEKWNTFSARFRQLSANPASGGTGVAYVKTGTILFFNGATTNLGTGNLETKSVNGSGAFSTDTYTMTLTADPAGGQWQLLEVNFAAAPALNSANITSIRFDPVGDAVDKNFEIDFIRITSIPEPGSLLLTGLGAMLGLGRRRR